MVFINVGGAGPGNTLSKLLTIRLEPFSSQRKSMIKAVNLVFQAYKRMHSVKHMEQADNDSRVFYIITVVISSSVFRPDPTIACHQRFAIG